MFSLLFCIIAFVCSIEIELGKTYSGYTIIYEIILDNIIHGEENQNIHFMIFLFLK